MKTGALGAPLLTQEQARTKRFKLPPLAMAMAFGIVVANEYANKISTIEANGGAADLFGWPDGTTVFWERSSPDDPLDEDKLEQAYYSFHSGIKLMKMRGHKC